MYKLPSFIDRKNSIDIANRRCMTNHSDDEDEEWLTQTEKIVVGHNKYLAKNQNKFVVPGEFFGLRPRLLSLHEKQSEKEVGAWHSSQEPHPWEVQF